MVVATNYAVDTVHNYIDTHISLGIALLLVYPVKKGLVSHGFLYS